MKIKLSKTGLILVLGILSCSYTEKGSLSGSDTAEVFRSIFDSKTFVKENIGRSDSVFLLKTKFYNKNWPQKNNRFYFLFIEDIPQNKILNFEPNSPYDGRTRLSVLKFLQRKDTVTVLMLDHGPNIYFNYSLVKRLGSWVVATEDVESGGRRSYYGFENDRWYLDLKKKVKKNDKYDSFKPKKPEE